MTFSARQVRALSRNPDHRYVRTREAHGRKLSYLQGWYAISEANRIFGFDGWSRETTECRCVLARENRGTFLAVYIARVRLTVRAGGTILIREGHGTGEGHGTSPGEVHDVAFKAAETDATKRALATFGRPFGLELYRDGKPASPNALPSLPIRAAQAAPRLGFHPDDTTPIPRPSRYYGRRQNQFGEHFRHANRPVNRTPPLAPTEAAAPSLVPGPIDKSLLSIAEPKRLRDKAHLKFVAAQACLICGRQPSDPHHLRFAQPRALGLKVSDEFTVPLCRGHHRELHQASNERTWWDNRKINPLDIAKELWRQTRPGVAHADPGQADRCQADAHQEQHQIGLSAAHEVGSIAGGIAGDGKNRTAAGEAGKITTELVSAPGTGGQANVVAAIEYTPPLLPDDYPPSRQSN